MRPAPLAQESGQHGCFQTTPPRTVALIVLPRQTEIFSIASGITPSQTTTEHVILLLRYH